VFRISEEGKAARTVEGCRAIEEEDTKLQFLLKDYLTDLFHGRLGNALSSTGHIAFSGRKINE
jgi:hypothetical protein